MNRLDRWAPLLALLVLAPGTLPGQARGSVVEWGVHSTMTAVRDGPVVSVIGPRLAFRTLGSARVALSLGAGFDEGEVSGRGEAAVEYLMSPRAADRLGVYFGGGLVGLAGARSGGYLLVYVGVERSPGLPKGWALEAGLGGGFRIRAAYHWRRFPQGWHSVK